MDRERFKSTCTFIMGQNQIRLGIGTLGEKTLHTVLKHYIEPRNEKHEMKMCGFIADIVNENGVTEIQTRSFEKLRKKLHAFLPLATVTVVYPIARTKWLFWLDTSTGELTKKRKSPKTGSSYEIYHELYKIKQWLDHPNFRLCIMLLDIEEYRNLDGWSKDGKKGSSRYERIPVDIIDEILLESAKDYTKIIPELPDHFTAKDFKKYSHLSIKAAQTALNVLNHIDVVDRVGKKGNAFIYEISKK